MQFLVDLWIPIVLSGIALFVISAVFWTVSPHHRTEYGSFVNEDAVRDVVRAANLEPGLYHFPHAADMKAMGSPEMAAKLNKGPNAFVTILPNGVTPMGPQMVKSFLSFVLVAVFVAYIAYHSIAPGAEYLAVFRLVGTVGFMTFALGSMQEPIWFGKPWKSWMLQAMDALVYGLVMAGIFGWQWG